MKVFARCFAKMLMAVFRICKLAQFKMARHIEKQLFRSFTSNDGLCYGKGIGSESLVCS